MRNCGMKHYFKHYATDQNKLQIKLYYHKTSVWRYTNHNTNLSRYVIELTYPNELFAAFP